MYTNLMDAYGTFKKKKSLKNLINLYNNAFTHSGISLWKLCRFLKNLVTGKYEKLYKYY